MQKTTYKQLQAVAQKHNITYAKRDENGKPVFLKKPELEKAIRAKLGLSPGDSIPELPPAAPRPSGLFDKALEKTINEVILEKIGAFEDLIKTIKPEPVFKGIELKKPDCEPVKISGHFHEKFELVLSYAQQRKNIFLTGPAGTGKTTLAEQIAKALELPFGVVSCSLGMSESQLQGWLLPVGESGTFQYVPAQFVKFFQNGGVFLLDEVDSADSNLLILINTALSNGYFSIPQNLDNPIIKKHPDFICIWSGNTYGHGGDRMHVGRNQLDSASLDRFTAQTVFIDYDPKIEEAVVDPKILKWGREVRGVIKAHKLRRALTTRVLRDFSEQRAFNPNLHTESLMKETYFQSWGESELSKVPDYLRN